MRLVLAMLSNGFASSRRYKVCNFAFFNGSKSFRQTEELLTGLIVAVCNASSGVKPACTMKSSSS